jgi:two-component system LytT family response regulator
MMSLMLEFLEKLLNRYFPEIFCLSFCESVDEAIHALINSIRISFSDVQMPNKKKWFQLFKELNKINFEVIFTTAHSEFAIDAINVVPDYLLKPINYIDLLKP